MNRAYPNEFWNDSCRLDEMKSAIAIGATGATSNPPLVWKAIQAEKSRAWRDGMRAVLKAGPSDEGAAWALIREVAAAAARPLERIWRESNGRMGLLSVQVDPRRHADAPFMIQQAVGLNRIAPNLSIKIPVTQAGLEAIEALTAQDINTTATVSFSVPQVIGAAEAFRRGLARFRDKNASRPVQSFAVVMVGRLDDHLRDAARESGVQIAEEVVTKAGMAVVKRAYQIFQERRYESRLLVGAMRGPYHITEFIGGDVVLTTPPALHAVFRGAAGELESRLRNPVPPPVIRELCDKLPDFRRAYEEEGMSPEEFDRFGPSAKTLDQFIGAFEEIALFAREVRAENE